MNNKEFAWSPDGMDLFSSFVDRIVVCKLTHASGLARALCG